MTPWTDDELAHVLAWVDHCKEKRLSFKDTVVDRLRAMTGSSRDWKIIESKLVNYKRDFSTVKDTPHMKTLLKEGTAIFPELSGDSDLTKKFREIKASLAANQPAVRVAQNADDEEDEDDEDGEDHGEDHGEDEDEDHGQDEGQGDHEGQGEHNDPGEGEDLADRLVREGLHSLQVNIERACNDLGLLDNMKADDDTFRVLAEKAFGSLRNAWNASVVEELREAFLCTFVTAHIFHVALASEFPSESLGVHVPFVKMMLALDLQQGLLNNESPEAGESADKSKDRPNGTLAKEREILAHAKGSPWFEEAVKAKAKSAAAEVVQMLGRINITPRNDPNRGTYEMTPEVVSEDLEPAYRSALRLKVDMILTSKQYTAQFFTYGRERDEREMSFEPDENMQIGPHVKACLFPQIRSSPIPDENPEVQDGMASPQIKYRTLSIAKTEDEVDGELVRKALVWA
ncbi:hypothetical protein PG984_009556 [Apiospora sp. TS-2023a]